MKPHKALVLMLAFLALAGIAAVSASSDTNGPPRNFEFTYLARIPALPADAKTSRIWIPLPQSSPYQTIANLKIDTPFTYTKYRDPEYGNEYVYLQIPAAKGSEPSEVRVSFEVTRHEDRVVLEAHPVTAQSALTSREVQRSLQPDRRVP